MTKRKAIGKRDRFEVFKRDSFTCQYCGAEAPKAVLHVDHILPVKEGGGNEVINLITACADCNLGKGARKLNDDSAITRQKQQLNELNERREQIEMLSSWRSGMSDLADRQLEIVVEDINELIAPMTLCETVYPKIKRLLKKHDLNKVLSAIDHSADYYLGSGVNQQSATRFIDAIPKSIKYISDPEHVHLARYINGIFRNSMHMSHADQSRLIKDLIQYHENGGSLKTLRDEAKGCTEAGLEQIWCDVDTHNGLAFSGTEG